MEKTKQMSSKQNLSLREQENQAMLNSFKNFPLLTRLENRRLHYGRISMPSDLNNSKVILGQFGLTFYRYHHEDTNGSSKLKEFTEMNCV